MRKEKRSRFCGSLGPIQVGVDYDSDWKLIQVFSLPNVFSQVAMSHTIDLMRVKFNFDKKISRINFNHYSLI